MAVCFDCHVWRSLTRTAVGSCGVERVALAEFAHALLQAMELPIDSVVLRGMSHLLSKAPESARQLFELMAEHNDLAASLVDVWLTKEGSNAPCRPVASTKCASQSSAGAQPSLDDERPSSLATSYASAGSGGGVTAKPSSRKEARPKTKQELFLPDLHMRPETKGRSPPQDGVRSLGNADGAEPADAPSALFSVPAAVKRKAPAPEGRDGEQKPTSRIKMAPRGIARSGGRSAHQAGPTPPRPSAVAKDAKALGSRVRPPPTNGGSARASSEEDVAVTLSPVSCHGSNNSLGDASLPASRTATDDAGTNNNHHRRNGANGSANNPDRLEGDSSDSDDYSLLHSSTDRSFKGRKRVRAFSSSDEDDDSDAFSDNGRVISNGRGISSNSSSSSRTARPPRKCKPPDSALFDGITISSSGSGSDDEADDQDSALSRSHSPTNGDSATGSGPLSSTKAGGIGTQGSVRPNSAHRLPTKPLGLGSRSSGGGGGSHTPDTPSRSFPPATTPTGSSRPAFFSQSSRSSTSGSTSSRPSSSSSTGNRKFEAMKKQAKKLSQGRVARK
ncbi:uncharacterized protein LOC135829970 [Sycon ciliatum]|uniref:uncharacterized protein LOC135829970 n=1 Tax=Sycon ciliatum TaxID=27933 RepID=UPI0031F63782